MRAENPPGENCGTCTFAYRTPGGAKTRDNPEGFNLNCRRNPPSVTHIQVLGTKTPTNPDGIYSATRGDFPPIVPLQWCGEWAEDVADGEGEPGRVIEGSANPS